MINSVLKAIKILQIFTAAEPRLSLAEISRRLAMPKSTTHNLLNTLLSEGFIEKVADDRYALGASALILTQNIRLNVEVRDPAAPLLRKLADDTHESVYLTVLYGDFALYIYAVESPRRLEARTAVGDLVHLHCTAAGKAMLAFLEPAQVDQIIARVGQPRFTDNTIVTLEKLHHQLAQVRQQGYALDQGEHLASTTCIGAAIINAKGQVLGGCSVSGAGEEVVTTRLAELSDQVVTTARQISRLMGYVPVRR